MYSIRRFFSDSKRRTAKHWAKLTLEDKRKHYSCGENYVTLDNLETWQKYKTLKSLVARQKPLYEAKETLNEKVTLWKGDITCLEIDAIVNAANSSLLEGGGVDECIHRAASESLLDECHTLGGCNTGHAKLTSGHRLPARYVLHAVGPMGKTPKNEKLLQRCYSTCLELALEHRIRSLAFCCISTGIFGYPNKDAASVALNTVRKWLEFSENAEKIDRIIFCTFLSVDVEIYEALLPLYFPDAAESSVQYEEESATDATDSKKKEAMPVSDSSVPEKEIQSSNETSNVVEEEETSLFFPDTKDDHARSVTEEKRGDSDRTFFQQRVQTLLGDLESERQNGERLQRECSVLAAERDRLCEENRLLSNHKEETEKNLRRAQQYENLLSIPPSDVRITHINLGRGSYGEVKVGHWRGCTVAVKEFYEALEGEWYLKLFQQEMAVISHVRHPNIVSLCGVTAESDTPLRIITELLEGSISDVYIAALRAKRPLCVREQVDLAVGFTSGIAYLHQLRPNAILHGDIRSTNVLVTILMEAKVCDLGAARFKGASLSVGPLSGEYLAPERTQADPREGQKGNSTMADVYSLGVTVIELMIGESPARTRRYDQLANVCHPQINHLAMRMIEKDSSLRPSAQDCLDMLQRVQKSDEEYAACPLKRMVRGKLYGDGHMTLVDRPWPHVNRPNI